MIIERRRALYSLIIGGVICLPIFGEYILGSAEYGEPFATLMGMLSAPAVLLYCVPLIFISIAFPYQGILFTRLVYFGMPIVSVLFYAAIAYGVLTLIARKK